METLVLSSTWKPMARITWQRAMTLFFAGRAEVIEHYEDKHVRTVSVRFGMPSVIRYLRGHKKQHHARVKFSRHNVYARDQGACQYCGTSVPRHEATFDHVRPRCQGGLTNWSNIVIACLRCNQRKGGRTPSQAHMTLRNAPREPKKTPDELRLTFTRDKTMPLQWKPYLAAFGYWYGELEHDEDTID